MNSKTNNTKKKIFYHLISLATVITILGIWEIVAYFIELPHVLPRFSSVAKEFFLLLASKDFYLITSLTLARCIIGFSCAFVLGVILGALASKSQAFRCVLKPIMVFLRSVPTMALTLILLVWLRNSYTPIMIGFIMSFPIIYRTMCDSMMNIDEKLKEMVSLYNLSPLKKIKFLYIPEISPVLVGSMITAFGLTIKSVISAEILSYTVNIIGKKTITSMGNAMRLAKDDIFTGTPKLFAWVIVALLLSLLVDLLLTFIQNKLIKKWK